MNCLAESEVTGRYEIVAQLGVGGMGRVHLGRQRATGNVVALKRLHDFIADDVEHRGILEDEARLAACIRHPNVVSVIEFIPGDAANHATLVMEYVEGANLEVLLRAAKAADIRLPLDVAVAIMSDALAGLHASHEARRGDGLALEIVHRDVSPQNILVGFDGVTRITDFGVAKAAWRQQTTVAGVIKGKLTYLAPEQLDGKATRSTDLYSAGAVLWELVSGRPLRDPASGLQSLIQILQNMIPSVSEERPEAAPLDDIIMRALAKCPEDRFATAIEMAGLMTSRVAPASPERVAEVMGTLLRRTATPTQAGARTAAAILARMSEPDTQLRVSTATSHIAAPVSGPSFGAMSHFPQRSQRMGESSSARLAGAAGARTSTPRRGCRRASATGLPTRMWLKHSRRHEGVLRWDLQGQRRPVQPARSRGVGGRRYRTEPQACRPPDGRGAGPREPSEATLHGDDETADLHASPSARRQRNQDCPRDRGTFERRSEASGRS
jgi:serine/threonine protein kinase